MDTNGRCRLQVAGCSMFDVRSSILHVPGSLQTANYAKYGKEKELGGQRRSAVGESVIDSNPFWFRVVRVFRGFPRAIAQPHCRNNATATRTPGASKRPNSKLLCAQRQATQQMLLRAWNANCTTAEQSHNEMISHIKMQQDRSVPGRSTFNVQGSTFNVQLLPQKN